MQSWLRQHPQVTRYVVLDDEDDCLDELTLFQPSSKTGLTEEICHGIEEYLASRSDKDMRANAIVRFGQNVHSLFKRDKSFAKLPWPVISAAWNLLRNRTL
jgi:hypothetical protein